MGLTGNAGTNAMVSRAARSVLAAARQYTVQSAAEAAASALSGEDGDGEQVSVPWQLLNLTGSVAVLGVRWFHSSAEGRVALC